MSPRSFAKGEKTEKKKDLSYEAAFEKALSLLEYRSRTASQMLRALSEREYPEDVATAVVERLMELGLINDAEYAQRFVQSSLRKGHGTRRAKYELRMRGVEDSLTDAAIDDVDEDAEFAAAMPKAKTLYKRYADLPPRERAGKISRALAGRGFGYDVISSVLRALDSELEMED